MGLDRYEGIIYVEKLWDESGPFQATGIDDPVYFPLDPGIFQPVVGKSYRVVIVRDDEGDLMATEMEDVEEPQFPPIVAPPSDFPGVPVLRWEFSARNYPDDIDAMLDLGWEPFAVTQRERENAVVWMRRARMDDNGGS